jgi:hypothetical protein
VKADIELHEGFENRSLKTLAVRVAQETVLIAPEM